MADEVSLGKTIEAGDIKEYMIRGLAKDFDLVPASLVSQWVAELNSKFYIPASLTGKAILGNSRQHGHL